MNKKQQYKKLKLQLENLTGKKVRLVENAIQINRFEYKWLQTDRLHSITKEFQKLDKTHKELEAAKNQIEQEQKPVAKLIALLPKWEKKVIAILKQHNLKATTIIPDNSTPTYDGLKRFKAEIYIGFETELQISPDEQKEIHEQLNKSVAEVFSNSKIVEFRVAWNSSITIRCDFKL